MRTNRNNENALEYNKIYMSFAIEQGHQNDIMEAVWNYAKDVCSKGSEYIRKNLITCKPANSATIYWEYEPAEPGDWYCKFCCAVKNSGITVNAFVNSRFDEDTNNDVYYVRLSLTINSQPARKNIFNGRTGILASRIQARDFDGLWENISGSELQYMKMSA